MPRPERPLDATVGPAAVFAVQLRAVREQSGLTYRNLAIRANYSHAHLVRAASGDELPSWDVTMAYLLGCGVHAAELPKWKSHWETTKQRIDSANPWDAITSRRHTGSGITILDPDAHLTDLAVSVDRTSIESGSLRSISTFLGLGDALQRLSQREGPITLRDLSRRAGIGSSLLSGWFSGTVTPDRDLLASLTVSLGCGWREQYEFLRCFEVVNQARLTEPPERLG